MGRVTETSIAGYRPRGESKPDKVYSTTYLQQDKGAAETGKELYRLVWSEEDLFRGGESTGVPCVRDPEKYTGDDPPTDMEAAIMCAQCPMAVFAACKKYAEVANPAHGVYAGEVHGRALQKAMEEE